MLKSSHAKKAVILDLCEKYGLPHDKKRPNFIESHPRSIQQQQVWDLMSKHESEIEESVSVYIQHV